jgi:hypothetical protein
LCDGVKFQDLLENYLKLWELWKTFSCPKRRQNKEKGNPLSCDKKCCRNFHVIKNFSFKTFSLSRAIYATPSANYECMYMQIKWFVLSQALHVLSGKHQQRRRKLFLYITRERKSVKRILILFLWFSYTFYVSVAKIKTRMHIPNHQRG